MTEKQEFYLFFMYSVLINYFAKFFNFAIDNLSIIVYYIIIKSNLFPEYALWEVKGVLKNEK